MTSKISYMFRHRDWLSLIDLKDKDTLDLGHDHLSALYALKKGARVSVARTSKEELKKIKCELGAIKHEEIYLSDLNFEFKNRFDVIIISDLSKFFRFHNMLREKQPFLISRLYKILKDQGVLIFGAPNKLSISYDTEAKGSKYSSVFPQALSPFFYTESELRKLLNAGGFNDIKLFAAYPNSECCIRFSSYPPNISLSFPGYAPDRLSIRNIKVKMLHVLEKLNLAKCFTPSFIVLVNKNA